MEFCEPGPIFHLGLQRIQRVTIALRLSGAQNEILRTGSTIPSWIPVSLWEREDFFHPFMKKEEGGRNT
jgi:hypothetical protein